MHPSVMFRMRTRTPPRGWRNCELLEAETESIRFRLQFGRVRFLEFGKIEKFPLDRRIVLEILKLIAFPLWFTNFKTQKELFVGICHQQTHISNQFSACLLKIFIRERDVCHSFKLIDHRQTLVQKFRC